jgi:hypothetical protein
MIAYAYDEKLHESINRSGKNFWDIYIREINNLLGIGANGLSLHELEDTR